MMSKTEYRVIHVFPYSAELPGGHSNAIIAFMEGQMQRGIDVRGIFPSNETTSPERNRCISHLPIQELDFNAPNSCRRVLASAANCQNLIFHFHGFSPQYVRWGRELAKQRIPYVITSHGQLHYRNLFHWLKKFAYLNFGPSFFHNASGLHFLTQRESDRCKYLLPFWRKPHFIQPIPVVSPDPGAVKPASRRDYGIPDRAFVFAYLGRIDAKHKGLDLLVKAFARLAAEPDLYLLLIGPDWSGGRQASENLAKRLNCEDRIRFMDGQYGERKWSTLKMADAFVSPSRWEAFGISQVEAIGFGLPTIVSTQSNLAPELASHKAALVGSTSPSALADMMRELFQNHQLRQSLADAGRKWVRETCSPLSAGSRFEDLYLQVLRDHRRSHPTDSRFPVNIQDDARRGVVNVVHVFPYSPAISGGHSNAIRSFIACQRAKGINAVGIAPAGAAATAETNFEFPVAGVDSLWSLRWETIAKRFKIEAESSVVHFHSVNRKFAPLLSDLRRTRVPYVLTSHGQLMFRSIVHWLQKYIYLNWLDRSVRKAAGLHLLTGLANQRLKFLLPGYDGLRLVQGNLVTVPDKVALPAASRSDYGIPKDAFVLIFLGRLDVWTKGLDILIEAFASLPTGRFRLVMAGPDWNGGQAKLERLAGQLGCGDRIHFPGPVYGDKKYALLRMADVFVSPSRYEAFGITFMEAMVCGLPLVTSTKLNLAPDLTAADAALITPLSAELIARAVARLEADPELRQALAGRGKAWAEMNCDPDRAGVRFLEFYQSMLETQQTANRSFPLTVADGT